MTRINLIKTAIFVGTLILVGCNSSDDAVTSKNASATSVGGGRAEQPATADDVAEAEKGKEEAARYGERQGADSERGVPQRTEEVGKEYAKTLINIVRGRAQRWARPLCISTSRSRRIPSAEGFE